MTPPPGSAEEQARGIALDLLEKWNDRGWLFRMDFDDQLKFLTPELIRLLTTHAREARRLAFQDFNKALREWAEHCKTRYVDEPLRAKHDAQGWNRAMDYVIAHLASARAQATAGASPHIHASGGNCDCHYPPPRQAEEGEHAN